MTHHVTCHVTCSLTDSVSVSEGAGLSRTCQQKTFYFSNASPCALRQQFNIKSIFNDHTLALCFFCLHKRWLIGPGVSLLVHWTSWHHVSKISKTAKGQNRLKCQDVLSLRLYPTGLHGECWCALQTQSLLEYLVHGLQCFNRNLNGHKTLRCSHSVRLSSWL